MRRFFLFFALIAGGPCLADNTYVVDTVTDGGGGSLRNAIQQMQASNGIQTIQFQIPGTSALLLTAPLPALVGQSIVLDGSASPGLRIQGAGWSMLKFIVGDSGQNIRLDHLHLSGGSNAQGGGCVAVETGGTLLVFDSTFDNCSSSGIAGTVSGGGAIKTNGNLRLTRDRFSNNASSDESVAIDRNFGGAVLAYSHTVLIESTQFFGNHTDGSPANSTSCLGGSGGALSITVPDGGIASLTDVQFVNNSASCPSTGSRQTGTAGALALYGQGLTSVVKLDRVYFSKNEAFYGGAIAAFSVRLLLDNATFFENSAYAVGGIWLDAHIVGWQPSSIQLRNSTFARSNSQSSSSASHLHLSHGATITDVRNTVFAKPLSGPGCMPAVVNVQTGAAVFTGDDSCFFFLPGAQDSLTTAFPGNSFGLLEPTQSYGQVPTLHPPAGSVLIDNGSNAGCATLDARRLSRPVNGGLSALCDIGAVEVDPDRLFGNGLDY